MPILLAWRYLASSLCIKHKNIPVKKYFVSTHFISCLFPRRTIVIAIPKHIH